MRDMLGVTVVEGADVGAAGEAITGAVAGVGVVTGSGAEVGGKDIASATGSRRGGASIHSWRPTDGDGATTGAACSLAFSTNMRPGPSLSDESEDEES